MCFVYLTLVLPNISLCCTDDRQTQDTTPSIVYNAVLFHVNQLSTLLGPPAYRTDWFLQQVYTHVTTTDVWLELPYLIRGKGVVSVEQENWMSSPLMRQALSSRDTNLGGAGGVRRAVRTAAMNNYKNSCEIAVITGNWFELEEAEEEVGQNTNCLRASIILPCTTTLASVPALPMKL